MLVGAHERGGASAVGLQGHVIVAVGGRLAAAAAAKDIRAEVAAHESI